MNSITNYLQTLSTPSVLCDAESFCIKIAENPAERERAFKLRYDVFNLEQGKGLDDCQDSGLDSDEFDDICLHLIVIHKPTDAVVGTYRVLMGPVAIESGKGFYSETEFEIHRIEPIAHKIMEIGRSCVHPDFRTGAVVSMLWSGLGELLRRSGLRYLMGCVSMEINEKAGAWALYKMFKDTGCISGEIDSVPKPGFELPPSTEDEIAVFTNDKQAFNQIFPPLLKGYYRLGSRCCGIPLYDAAFKTIDFLMLLNIADMPPKYYTHFIEPATH